MQIARALLLLKAVIPFLSDNFFITDKNWYKFELIQRSKG